MATISLTKQSYLNPNTELRNCRHGKGLFAKYWIKKNSLIIDWEVGPGVLMPSKEAYEIEFAGNHFTLQVGDNKHLVSLHVIEPCDYINHSCNPNSGFKNNMRIVAMRDIQPGEEINFDYAMSESSPLFILHCDCRTEFCRQVIRGSDWQSKILQKRYGIYFSEYIHKKFRTSRGHRHRTLRTKKSCQFKLTAFNVASPRGFEPLSLE